MLSENVRETLSEGTIPIVKVSKDEISRWQKPPFQRPFKKTKRVSGLISVMQKNGGVFPGVITIGILDDVKYLLDGQHRVEAFNLSGLSEGTIELRMRRFESLASMSEEFVQLNSALARFCSDDILRGIEASNPILLSIRERCPFIGYGNTWRNQYSPILSMSVALRVWTASACKDSPSVGQLSVSKIMDILDETKATDLSEFYNICFSVWQRDVENKKLWTSLNLGIVGWIWMNMVKTQYSNRSTTLTPELFQKCLMAVSANKHYCDWLVGRLLSDRDRAPCYGRLRAIFVARCRVEGISRVAFPSPTWASNHMNARDAARFLRE